MATYGKPEKKHKLAKAFAKAAIYGLMIFASYQYYTPDRVKDAVGHKVEQTTSVHWLGKMMSSSKPATAQAIQPGTVEQQTPAPK